MRDSTSKIKIIKRWTASEDQHMWLSWDLTHMRECAHTHKYTHTTHNTNTDLVNLQLVYPKLKHHWFLRFVDNPVLLVGDAPGPALWFWLILLFLKQGQVCVRRCLWGRGSGRLGIFGHLFSGRYCTLHYEIAVGIWPLKLSLVSLNHGNFQDCLLEVNLASTRRCHKMRWDSFSSSEGTSTIIPCCLFGG